VKRLLLAAVLAAVPPAAVAADLTVTVEGIRSDKGDVYLAVFETPRHWPDGDKAEHQERRKAVPGTVTFTLRGLQPGTYAVASYHDENGNAVFDKNFLGLPKEGWAVSNDVRPHLRAPHFEEAAIVLPPEGRTIAIRLGY
jgi:uncharacterized protein (DUF2141 family)